MLDKRQRIWVHRIMQLQAPLNTLARACKLIVILGLFFFSSARAERAPLSAEQFAALLRQLVQESIPIVEYIAQRKFRAPPKVVIGDNAAATRSLAEDFLLQLRIRAAEVDGATLRAYAGQMASELIPSTVGKYGISDKTLYILPEHLHRAVEAQGISPSAMPELLRLVLIHELSHALHDQYFCLTTQILTSLGNMSQHTAFSTILEGFATYVEQRSAAFLGISEKTQRALLIKRVDKVGVMKEAYSMNLMAERYLIGAKFFHEIYRSEGDAGVWRQLANPPKDSDYIFRIAESTEESERIPRRDLTPALNELNTAFTGRGYTCTIQDLRGVQLAAYLGPRYKDHLGTRLWGAEITAQLIRNDEDRLIFFLLMRGINNTVVEDLEKGALDQFVADMRSLDKKGVNKTHRSFNYQNSNVNMVTYPHTVGNRVAQIAVIYVRHGLSFAMAVTRDALFSDAELLALTHSAAVSVEALFQKPLPATHTPARTAVITPRGRMSLKELKTMITMRFSEHEILDALAKRPLAETLDAKAQQQLGSLGATPAIIAKAAKPAPATAQSEPAGGQQQPAPPRIPAPAIPKLIEFEITERDLEALKK